MLKNDVCLIVIPELSVLKFYLIDFHGFHLFNEKSDTYLEDGCVQRHSDWLLTSNRCMSILDCLFCQHNWLSAQSLNVHGIISPCNIWAAKKCEKYT